MKVVTDYIDTYLNLELSDPYIHYYGLAELVTKSEERFPATVNNRDKVAIDNAYSAFCYHRVINNTPSFNDDISFGLKRKQQNSVVIRTVLGYKISEYDEMFRYDFASTMPQVIQLDGYEPIFLEPSNSIEDHEQLAIDESLQLPYEKHRLTWNLYAFESTIEIVVNEDCV